MCGISGFLDRTRSRQEGALRSEVLSMTATLRHRGPDDEGIWVDSAAGVALGHTRLSIVDLSPHGHQPMLSACGRYVIVFNGEIFNFRTLRSELETRGHRFRGHSDTEVLIASVVEWGVEGAVRRFVGMFAFALWDRVECRLHLVRDRLGIKPLYYGAAKGCLFFGSELKAMRAHPAFVAEVDRDALAAYLRFQYVPTPRTIYRGVSKLPAGTCLSLGLEDQAGSPEPVPYWSVRDVIAPHDRRRFDEPVGELIDELDLLLRDSVALRMQADVPLGAFLSGGIDSSTVVALMQVQSSRPIRTFTVGFDETSYDETTYARAVARHLGTEHTELRVEPRQALELIPQIPDWYDEPFGDSSQLPTFLISEATRKTVTVALSGDGGDEVFAGYERYFLTSAMWRILAGIPAAARASTLALLSRVSPRAVGRIAALMPRESFVSGRTGAGVFGSAEAFYRSRVSLWGDPDAVVLGGQEPREPPWSGSLAGTIPEVIERAQYIDLVTYLPDDILAKVDRASMAVSLEVRVPLLDHRVVEFAWKLPFSCKVRDRRGKWILREVLARYVPRELVERPKMGFGVPIDSWLRGPLRDWAETLLDEKRLRDAGFLDAARVRDKWEQHLSGRHDWHYPLWTVLMFEAWRDRWLGRT